MTKYLTEYRKYILSCLADESCDHKKILDYHREKLAHFQHERLIHLLVTFLFGISVIICFVAVCISEKLSLIPLCVILLIMLIAYVKHYYFLENTVQLLYKDYDRLYHKVYGFSQEDLK